MKRVYYIEGKYDTHIMSYRCREMIKKFKENDKPIDDGLSINKRQAICISCIFFFTYRIIFLVKHIGYFAFDEFYHISTLNPKYATNYNRAQYINFMVKIVCKILGQNDVTVKMVPFLMGIISFLCAMYLLYNIYDNPYWIITISSVLICLPNIAYNHFYIRMYVFLEAIIMLNCVLFYKAEKERGTKRGVLYILIAEVLTFLYSFNTNDFSSKALLILMIGVGVYYFVENYIKSIIKKYFVAKLGVGLLLLFGIIGIVFIVAAKQHWFGLWMFLNDAFIRLTGMNLETFYHADRPVFLQFIFVKLFYVSIPFMISLIYVLRKNIENQRLLLIIAGLPLLGYMTILYNSYLIRTYIAFFPILCIVSLVAFDKIKLTEVQHLIIIYIVLLLTINVQRNFWETPQIPSETSVLNLGEAVGIARELEKQGYEIVTFMTYETQSAYFDLLDVDINLNTMEVGSLAEYENDLDKYNKALRERKVYIHNTIEEILDSGTKRVLVVDQSGMGEFENVDWKGWNDNKCELRKFGGGASVIIVN